MANQSYIPTGTLPVNNLPDGATSDGIFNLVGNVWEWTSSYAPDISSNAAYITQTAWDGKAKAFDKDMSFVQRGGGWNNSIERITSRYYVGDRDGYQDAGFRCAVD
jgi:iron(II)-dependent oxidoreductase